MNFSTKYKLLIISVTGWIVIFLINILAWAKCNIIASEFYIFLPAIFMFVVTFPTLYLANNNRRVIEFDKLNPSSNGEGLSLAPFLNDSPRKN